MKLFEIMAEINSAAPLSTERAGFLRRSLREIEIERTKDFIQLERLDAIHYRDEIRNLKHGAQLCWDFQRSPRLAGEESVA